MSEPAAPAAAPNGSATPNNGLPPRFGAAPKAPAPSPAEQKAAAAEKEAAARQYVVDDIASQIAKSGFDPSKSVAENKHQAETPDVAKPDGKAATVKIGDVEIEPERFREIMARQAELDLAAAKRPADPSAYKVELPKDFAPPAGMPADWKILPDAPGVQAFKEWAHSVGLTQDQFSAGLAIYARQQAGICTDQRRSTAGARTARP